MRDSTRAVSRVLRAIDIIFMVSAVSVSSRYLIARKLDRSAKGPKQGPFCDSGNPELTDFVVRAARARDSMIERTGE